MLEMSVLEGKKLSFHNSWFASVLVKHKSDPFHSLKLLQINGAFVVEAKSPKLTEIVSIAHCLL